MTNTTSLGLDAEFDAVIDGLDAQLFRTPEDLYFPAEFLRNPIATLQEIRERWGTVVERSVVLAHGYTIPNVVLFDEDKPIFLVLNHDATLEVFRRNDVFSSRRALATSLEIAFGSSLGGMDDPEHRRHRALVQQAFAKSNVDRWSREVVDPTVDYLVARLARRGGGDLVRDLAAPLPFKVIAHVLGLANNDLGRFIELATRLLFFGYDPAGGLAAKEELGVYFSELIEARRRRATDDMISVLVHADLDGERLTDDAVIANLRFFLPAGVETTYRASSNMWRLLLADRVQFEAVLDDRDLVTAAVEEALRVEPPGIGGFRMAVVDTELDGVKIPAGSGVMPFLGMANRDGQRWEKPDEFDVRRTTQPNVTFGYGTHTCLGMHLARLQMASSLRQVAERIPSVRLVVPSGEVPTIGFTLRSVPSLPVAI